MVGCLSRDVSSPQWLADYAVGHQHDQQGKQVDQQNQCKLVAKRRKGRGKGNDINLFEMYFKL